MKKMDHMEQMNKTQIVTLLHEHGLKATLQRQIICEYLLNTSDHPSAEQIYKEISQSYPTIGRATIYSTLTNLKEKKIISELDFGSKAPSRFEPRIQPHINIICPSCHQIQDYESEKFSTFWTEITSDIRSKFHHPPIRQGVDLFVHCASCQKKIEK